MGYPNVKVAARERNALDIRYTSALKSAAVNGTADTVARFEEKAKGCFAVINVDLRFLHQFVTNGKALYTTYSLRLKGQMRRIARREDDAHRRAVEGILFGSYGDQIRYAALSLDGSGPTSYGPYAMRLREIAIEDRASLLEDNSFRFVEKHELRPLKPLPDGYRATWADRHKLAVAKLSARVGTATSEGDYAKILMFSEGEYATDDFLEVHIYGAFDNKSIEAVRGPSKAKGALERGLVAAVKRSLKSDGRRWIES